MKDETGGDHGTVWFSWFMVRRVEVFDSRQQSREPSLAFTSSQGGCFHRVNSYLDVGVAKCYTNKALASQRDAQDERGKPGSGLDTM